MTKRTFEAINEERKNEILKTALEMSEPLFQVTLDLLDENKRLKRIIEWMELNPGKKYPYFVS